MTRLGLLALGLVAVCLHACDPAGGANGSKEPGFPYPSPKVEESGEVVATVGTVVLTTAELEKRIQQQSPFVRAQLKDPEQKKKFVDNEVKIELLAQEGWRRNLHNDPRVIAEMRRAIVQRVMRDEMAELNKKVDLSEEELRQGYEKRTAEYNKPESIRLAQIVMAKNQKKQAEALAAKLIEAQKRNEETAFADAARKNSQDVATRNGGGELPFMTREELEKKLGKESTDRWFDQAEVGTVGIEETADAWVIFKKTGKRRGTQRTLEMVKPQLRGQLLAEKRQAAFEAYVDGLKKKDNVVVDENLVRSLKVKIDAPTPGTATATTPETKEVEVE
jgi:hypothetical protein